MGVTAFGAAALLFLVCEELLQQDGDEADTWWVQVQIYLGFILAFLLDQLADMASGEAQ